MQHINLETFAKGALTEQVNQAMEEVTKNIQNPNTDAKVARKITVTIAFKPNEKRDFVATGVQTKTTLAPVLGAVTAMSMGKNLKTGEVEACEIGNQIPGQMELSEIDMYNRVQVSENINGNETVQTVDPSTGEIYETPVTDRTNKVIDLRMAK